MPRHWNVGQDRGNQSYLGCLDPIHSHAPTCSRVLGSGCRSYLQILPWQWEERL
jgi:hypothetical protein